MRAILEKVDYPIILFGTTILGFLAGFFIGKIKYSIQSGTFIKLRKKKTK